MAWLGIWAKRRKITIDNTNVDSDLSHFPVPIVLGTSVGQSAQDVSDIFDEVGVNSFKIAITKVDGTTQIYGDIETWDDSVEKAVIHVAKSDLDVTSATVTELYFYFDSTQADNTTYISASGGTAAQSVYDSNVKASHNNADATTSTILDSTSNTNDGAKKAANQPVQADWSIGKCQNFDGNDDHISIPDSVDWFFGTDDISIEALVDFTALPTSGNRMTICGSTNGVSISWGLTLYNNSGTLQWELFAYNSVYVIQILENAISLSTSTEYYVAATRNGDSFSIFQDAVQCGSSDTDTSAFSDVASHLSIGSDGGGLNFLNGKLGMLRITKGDYRSVDWIKATKYALTDDLITFSSTETGSGTTTTTTTSTTSSTTTVTGSTTTSSTFSTSSTTSTSSSSTTTNTQSTTTSTTQTIDIIRIHQTYIVI